MDGSVTTRVYERGKTRLHTSSWVASAPKHQYCEGSGGGFVSDDDAQLHVLCDGVDDDGQCSVGKCASGQVLESNLLMAGGHVATLASVDDDTCGLNKFPVVRGGISLPLPLHCDLNEVPEVVVDEYALSDHCVSGAPQLQCDLNEIPNVVADEVVSDHVISETLTFRDIGVVKGEPVNGIICDGYIDVNIDETEILRTKGVVHIANFNNQKVQIDPHLHTRSTAGEEEHSECGNRMNLQTPQQKPRRRKHRPKVLVDGYKPRVQKTKARATIRKVKERLPKKKKFLSEIVPDVTEPMTIQSTRKSTRRPLDFDSMGFATDDWYPSNSEDVDNFHIGSEARGEKRGYSSTISNSIDVGNVQEFIPFLKISKRRRTTQRKRSLSSIKCWLVMAKFLSEPMVIRGCLEEIQRTKCPTPQAKRSKGFVRVRRLSFSPLIFKFFKQKYKAVRDLITGVKVQIHRKKRSRRLSKGKTWSNIIKMEQLYERKLVQYKYQRSSFKSRASTQDDDLWELQPTVDEIVERLQNLNINREDNVNYRRSTLLARFNSRFQGKDAYISSFDITNGEEYALVPYRRDGTLVPFVKKKLPRPRVELDAETNRIWNLLLEDINNPGIDGSDEETARKWSTERNVFRERANLFIARMHLIQGDRRFSPWKGSVLDSVIGVFLTQNVSDHLSSSAFMSLAAKFPCKRQSSDKMHHDKGADLSNDGMESSITNSGQNYFVIGQPVDDFDFENPVNSALALENFGTPRQFIDLRTGSNLSNGGLGTSKISANSSALETMEGAIIMINENISAVNVSSQSSSDSYTQTFSGAGLPCDEIPVLNFELETGYQNSNHSTYQEVLEYLDSREGCNTLTCEVSLERELDAVLSDVRSQSEGGLLSLSRDFEVSETPTNQQLHLTFDLEAENLEYTKIGNTLSRGSYAQLKEQTSTSQYEDFAEHSRARSLSCQGACTESDIGSCPCLIPESSHNVEFPATKGSGDHTTVHNSASRKKEAEAHKAKTRRVGRNIDHTYDWDSLRKHAQETNKRENSADAMDLIDYESLRKADVSEIASVIKKRGMNAMLAERIQDFLNGLVAKHGSMNVEWLRDVLPDQAKEYLLTVRGLGLKSVECVRLLTLHQLAFPVDTNVGRIAVRLGWVPLQPLPESLQLHLLEQYPVLESIQKHLWPRLCKLDQKTLYELHYQMITFGKVFCTKTKPNCNSCPMRGDCRHFASEFASSRLAIPSSKDKPTILGKSGKSDEDTTLAPGKDFSNLLQWFSSQREGHIQLGTTHPTERAHCEPIIEVPASPEPMYERILDRDIEDIGMSDSSDCEDSVQIPTIKLNIAEFAQNLQNYVHENMEIQESELSKALVALTPEAASIPPRKLKNASGLRTEHQVYVLPDDHPLLEKFDKREPDDPSPYLLAIWTPGETAKSIQPPEYKCDQEQGKRCNEETCLLCSSARESEDQIVRGTILIPCRTAMRGSFPLNGTYFQVNEVFADFHSSHNPIEVPRDLIWDLQTRTVFFGTSVPTIFRGMVTEHIQQCFWKGYICVRGFDKETRAPRPLAPRLHTAKSLLPKPKPSVKKTKGPRNANSRK